MQQDTNFFTLQNICKSFNKTILDDISFSVSKGEVISILGSSGAGKTTLLRVANFLEKADSGSIFFDGETFDLKNTSKKDILRFRKNTAFVFQGYNLFRNKTALQNVSEGLIVARKIPKDKAIELSKAALDKVNLSDKYNSYPSELSGGESQRVAIARAVVTNPKIIFFDEPTSALDPELTGEVLSVIKNLADEGMTMLIVTHEMEFAKNVSKKIIFLDEGKILSISSAKDFFENPKEQRIKQFLSTYSKAKDHGGQNE